MIYVASDIHGNFDKYQALLEKINLTEKDALIILGDIVDRGSSSMELILDMIKRENVFFIFGNHDQMALACLSTLNQEITEQSIEKFDEGITDMIIKWCYSYGGQATLDEFKTLSQDDKNAVLEYLADASLYEELEINGQKYLLVHGGLDNFSPDKDIDDYTEDELVWARADYTKVYFEDKILITGHTPTANIIDNPDPKRIFKGNNHIAIDCGCGFKGGQLACICLNTMEEFYV